MMQTQSWKLAGGLNLVRDAITRHRAPGELIGCMNYESREEGYRRIDGIERYDGRKSPSAILDDNPGQEDIEAEKRRAAIEPVSGDEMLATWRYRDRTYAFVRDSDALTMYGSSSAGWVEIDLGWRVAFTDGTGDAPENDEALANASAVGATVIGHYLTGGTWAGGDAAGFLVFAYDAAGRFAASDSLTVAATVARTLTISDVPTQQTIGDGTATAFEFQFLNQNFFGQANRTRMYGVSGVGELFEFDGTMFLQLPTGVTTSFPTRVSAHKQHLFVGYPEGSIVYSGTGLPRSYDANAGAGEIAIGDTLSGMVAGYRDTLFIYGRNKTVYLTGTGGSNSPFVLHTLSDEAGAMAGTEVLMDQPTVLDDRGIRNTVATESFGDFSIATISEPIRPLLDFKREGGSLPVCSTRIRRKSQYRVFFDDGDCIVLNLVRRRGRPGAEYTQCAYDLVDEAGRSNVGILTSVCSVEDSDGRERVFCTILGSMHVYEMDRGKSFDGHPIPYYMRLPYNDFKAPHVIKRYRKLLLEVTSTFESTFSISADYDDESEEGERGQEHTIIGPSSFWSEMDWSASYWNTVPIRAAHQRLHGRGRNLSIAIYSIPDKVEEAHVVTGVTVFYEPRRMKR